MADPKLESVIDERRRGRLCALALVPAAVLALLPSATCPLCIAAYAGVLSAVGLGFLFDEPVLAPLIGVFLVLGVASIAYSTRSHRRYGPLLVTSVGSGAVAAGRLVWDIPFLLYSRVALLIGAAIWNLWLKRPRLSPSLPAANSHDSQRGPAMPGCCENRDRTIVNVRSSTLRIEGMS